MRIQTEVTEFRNTTDVTRSIDRTDSEMESLGSEKKYLQRVGYAIQRIPSRRVLIVIFHSAFSFIFLTNHLYNRWSLTHFCHSGGNIPGMLGCSTTSRLSDIEELSYHWNLFLKGFRPVVPWTDLATQINVKLLLIWSWSYFTSILR